MSSTLGTIQLIECQLNHRVRRYHLAPEGRGVTTVLMLAPRAGQASVR